MSERDDTWPSSGRWKVTPARVLWALLALCVLILLFQNSGDTDVHLFWLDVTAPLFLVIGASLLLGWGIGELGSRVWRWRRRGDS